MTKIMIKMMVSTKMKKIVMMMLQTMEMLKNQRRKRSRRKGAKRKNANNIKKNLHASKSAEEKFSLN